MNKNTMLDYALKYARKGLAVFPCHNITTNGCSCGIKNCDKPGKHPRTSHGFKDATLDEESVKYYWKKFPDANIGCATGAVSDIVGLDVDKKHGRSGSEFQIPPTVCVKTGGGGNHYFFKYPGYHIKSTNGQVFGPGVDIKADGGYVILAPSSHISGKRYEWIIGPDDADFAEMPEWLIKALKEPEISKDKNAEKLWKTAPSEVSEGNRNETAASMAGKIRQSLAPELRETVGWPGFVSWNSAISEPLPEKELRSVWESISRYDKNKKQNDKDDEGKPSIEEMVLNKILNDSEATLFHDEQKEAYISLNISGHHEVWPCKSKTVKRLLSCIAWEISKKPLRSESINNITSILEGHAFFNGPKINLQNRAGWHNSDLWYDLTNEKWQAVKINKNGWSIEDKVPILFKRYSHHKAQVIPTASGDIKRFLYYINVTDPEHKLLLLVFLVGCFIPDFPHPMLVVFGAQGSSKSTLSKFSRSIVDPSMLDVVALPTAQNELVQTLAHNYFVFFDNLSYISEETSDTLAKAITGSGFSKRELYENDEDIIYKFKRSIGINGINLVATRPDLLDRSLLVELERIEPENRKSEKDLYKKFEQDLPIILGGIFDVLVKTLKIEENIKIKQFPRMADFCHWGCAIAEALGYKQEEFLTAYQNNINRQTEMLINENVVATAIIAFMEDKSEWRDTPTKLMDALYAHATLVNIDMREKYWPKGAAALSRRLRELSTPLKQMGYLVTISTSGTERWIRIQKAQKPNQYKVDLTNGQPKSVPPDDTDDVSSVLLEQLSL